MQLKHQQWCIFTLTWIAYAGTYLLRKPLAVVKADLASELFMTRTDLGWLDTAMLFPYAVVQMVFGSIADHYGARRTLGACLLISSMSMASFGMWHSVYLYAVFLFINGAAQSQAWPSCVKSLSAWYTTQQRNAVFGIWGTCTFAGGIAGTALAVHLQMNYGWRHTFLVPSLLLGSIGLTVVLFLHNPSDYQVIPGKDLEGSSLVAEKSDHSSLTFAQLWKLPALKEVAVCMFCVKVVRYSMFMWLPMYLNQQLNYGKARSGMLPTSFEIGGVIGSASMGYLIQRLLQGQTLKACSLAILASTISLLCFLLTTSQGALFNIVFMLVAGAFNCGIDPVLGGSVPSELGELSGRNIQASVSGFINGFLRLGTVLQGPVIGALTERYGWSSMLYMIVSLSLVGCVASMKGHMIKSRAQGHQQLGL